VAHAAHHLAEGVGEREGIDKSKKIERKFVRPVGFSNGVAEFWSRKPPPFVPSCLMASMKPIGPRGIVWMTPLSASWR